MDAAILNAEENQTRLRVSVTARLIALVAFTIPLIGGALSSFYMLGVFRALRDNETVGVGVVMEAIKEASLPVIVSLCLAAVVALVVIVVLVVRMIVQTKTASPPFWFFVLGGILCLVPVGLFWKTKLLFLEVLSPGSSIAPAGISGVAAESNLLLWMSIIALPVVFFILLLISVLPFSSRAGKKWGSLVVATGIEFLFIATAIAIPLLIDGPKRKNEIVELPPSVMSAYQDNDLAKHSSMILTLTADNKLYQREIREVNGKVESVETVITNQELPEKVKRSMEGKTPDERIVYFKCDVKTPVGYALEVFDVIRRAGVDRLGLVVIGAKNRDDPYQVTSLSYEILLQELIDDKIVRKPNPLTLVAMLEKDGKLRLNNEETGYLPDSKKLETMLTRVFTERENNGVFRERTNEIEKKVFVKASKSTKYGDFIKLFEAVKISGAQPIGIQIDDVIFSN